MPEIMAHSTILRFKATPPYDFALTVHKPAGWSLMTPFEIYEKGILWTVMTTPSGKMYGLKLWSLGTVENPEITCKIYASQELDATEKTEVSETIAWVLNLREDIRAFYTMAKHDKLVKILMKDLYGMKSTRQPDIFPRLTLAVTLQMAPIARSNQMMNLLIREYGERVRFDGEEILYWPTPDKIANADVEELQRKCKLGYRAKSLKSIAQAIRNGFPTFQELERMPDKEAKAKLMELTGIGEYSTDIVSPHQGFALDVWSAKIFSLILLGKKTENPRSLIPELKKIAEERWGAWRGYVFIYVLHDLNNLSREFKMNLTQT